MFKTKSEFLQNCKAENAVVMRNKYVLQYKRRSNKKPQGLVVAFTSPHDNEVYIGWSLCRKTDKFSKEEGLSRAFKNSIPFSIAYYKATSTHSTTQDFNKDIKLPHSLSKVFFSVLDKANAKLNKQESNAVNFNNTLTRFVNAFNKAEFVFNGENGRIIFK